MKLIMLCIGSLLFIFSAAAFIYVKIKLRPKEEDIGETYWEFEHTLPEMVHYLRYSRITFAGMVIGALILFVTLIF